MGAGSGGGGSGGRSGGGGSSGGTSGDAGQPGEVVREANKANEPGADYNRATSQIETLTAEIAKTNRAYDAATQAGNMAERKMLRQLRSSLETKKSEIERARQGMKAVFKIPK